MAPHWNLEVLLAASIGVFFSTIELLYPTETCACNLGTFEHRIVALTSKEGDSPFKACHLLPCVERFSFKYKGSLLGFKGTHPRFNNMWSGSVPTSLFSAKLLPSKVSDLRYLDTPRVL